MAHEAISGSVGPGAQSVVIRRSRCSTISLSYEEAGEQNNLLSYKRCVLLFLRAVSFEFAR